MSAGASNDPHTIADERALRELYGPTHPIAKIKCLDALDDHARAFIERSPFLCLSTQGADGGADVTPRGDAPGFVAMLDERTLAIPDRPGNNRLDSLTNILGNPAVGLLFLVPGFDDTLRVNGRATLSTEPSLLAGMIVNAKTPTLAIVIDVEEVFLHCAKAFRRARLWDPTARQDRREMPSLRKMVLDQTTGAPDDPAEVARLDAELEAEYERTMY